MKREYAKPLFYAEKYMVASSIASCDYHVGDSEDYRLLINKDDKVCVHLKENGTYGADNGHPAGKNGATITKYPLYLFNDGSDNDYCEYDWNGSGNVTGPKGESYGNFGEAFFGSKSDNKNHRPGYNGQTFFS